MSQRIVWIGAGLLLCVSACANIWSFQDFQSGDDASVDGGSNQADGGHGDATLDARDSGAHDGARDARDADAEAACPIGTCNGMCIDTMTDPKNCGGCGTVCTAGAPCQGGMCICPGTERLCGMGDAGVCITTMSDESNCGGCGNTCASGATCVNSACVCPTGQKVCPTGVMGDGGAGATCADLNSDPNNCGGCGTICGTTASCIGGVCQPCGSVTTQIMCGTPVHCVDSATDKTHCGGCGTSCIPTEICAKSKCLCPGSETLCGADGGAAATCYDLSVNQKNCGSCGNVCLGGTVCQGGNCVCPPGTHSCGTGAAATCLKNTSTSSCGTTSCSVCPIPAGGTTTCDGMSCGDTCGSAALPTLCPPGGGANAACVNTTTDPNHCGGCGTPCNTTNAVESCAASTCAVSSCGNGFANCDKLASTGCEVDTLHDTSNCGSCGHGCPMAGAAEVCTNGTCDVSTCKVAGTVDCDGNPANGCEVNITNDANNCSGCGKVCSTNNAIEACTASKCTISACTAGFADCDKTAANGCEINTTNDPSNCGGCGKTCSQAGGTGTCVGSTCKIKCEAGFADCDGNVANGCETAITTTSNCGVCGKVCSTTNATEACSSTSGGYACSITTCNAGFDDCDHNASNGCEINLNTDKLNCGGCTQACSTAGGAMESCQRGICSSVVCTDPTRADCNGIAKDGCETLINTPSHCGDCNTSCSTNNVTEACTAPGTASPCSIPTNGCKAGFADCDKDPTNGCEVNTGGDTSNCGACGRVCPSVGGMATCTNGACGVTCLSPNADCDKNPANGCEVNTSTDSSHCGSCTTPCSTNHATESCSSSTCSVTACASGFADCDNSAANGCEVNTGADTNNCGACKAKCSTANATEACSGGACAITACSAGFMDCDNTAANGCEIHTATDPTHCGSCTNACSMVGGTQGCSGGMCGGLVCASPMADCNMMSADGCEVDLFTDAKNCGTCGHVCTALDQCHVAGTCNAGTCTNPLKSGACDDADPCTTGDVCTNGTCAGTPKTCTASDSCHVAGTCSSITGMCSNPPAGNGTGCTGSNLCDTYACQNGICTGTPLPCTSPPDTCHTSPGTCNPSNGMCSYPALPCTTPPDRCSTAPGVCVSGACVYSPVSCAMPQDMCHSSPGTCNPSDGSCSYPAVSCTSPPDMCHSPTGTCNTSNGMCSYSAVSCTSPPDMCHSPTGTCNTSNGMCSYSAVSCMSPPDLCHSPTGTCNTTNGMCSYSAVSCMSPPDLCHTSPGACNGSNGMCSYPAVSCTTPPDVCHTSPGTCSNIDGSCAYSPGNEGGTCTGTNECLANSCVAGTCTPGLPVVDGTPCRSGASTCLAGICL